MRNFAKSDHAAQPACVQTQCSHLSLDLAHKNVDKLFTDTGAEAMVFWFLEKTYVLMAVGLNPRNVYRMDIFSHYLSEQNGVSERSELTPF